MSSAESNLPDADERDPLEEVDVAACAEFFSCSDDDIAAAAQLVADRVSGSSMATYRRAVDDAVTALQQGFGWQDVDSIRAFVRTVAPPPVWASATRRRVTASSREAPGQRLLLLLVGLPLALTVVAAIIGFVVNGPRGLVSVLAVVYVSSTALGVVALKVRTVRRRVRSLSNIMMGLPDDPME